MIRSIFRKFRGFLIKNRWKLQYIKCKLYKIADNNLTYLNIEEKNNILILAPHADDEWIGCYSILKYRLENVRCMYFNLYGDNQTDENRRIRNSEINNSALYNSFELINNYK